MEFSCTSRASGSGGCLESQHQAARVLYDVFDAAQEENRLPAVDQPVVVRQRDVHHGPDLRSSKRVLEIQSGARPPRSSPDHCEGWRESTVSHVHADCCPCVGGGVNPTRGRTTISSLITTGRFCTLCIPMMADCGGLMMGVDSRLSCVQPRTQLAAAVLIFDLAQGASLRYGAPLNSLALLFLQHCSLTVWDTGASSP
jgi:hypothetical protein